MNVTTRSLTHVSMVKFPLFLLGLIWAIGSQAQIDIDTNYVFKTGSSSEFEIIAKNNIHNTSEVNDTLTWLRLNQDLTSGWASAACDNQVCYFPETDSGEFYIGAKESSNFDVYFYPQSNEGEGTVQILIYRNSLGRLKGDTLTYECSTMAVGLSEPLNGSIVSVYPTIVQDQISIDYSQSATVQILQKGSIVLSQNHSSGVSNISTSQLASGQYLIRVTWNGESRVSSFLKL